jgi:dTDP-glucose 4,6-dehydratase
MRILVYGHKGWIGNQFIDILNFKKENKNELFEFKYVLGNSRVDDFKQLESEIDECNPTHIVSFIGRTHGKIGNKEYTTIDYLEQKGKLKENVRDNLFSPLSLALICQKRKIHYTYLGTGCIFTYIKGKEDIGFTEESLPNFTGSGYSTVKGFTDMLMHQLEDTVLNLRIRMPIVGYDNPRNFITKITNYEKICSVPNSMTVLPELLPVIFEMMKVNKVGTINLTNPGVITHNEILEMYKEYVDPLFTWKNFTIEEQNQILASERSNNLLDTQKLQTFFPEVKHIKDSVRLLLQNYKKEIKEKEIKEKETNENENEKKINFKDDSNNILLVTGGCGFIGSNFINNFFSKYNFVKVINIDALYYCANENNIKDEIRNNSRYIFINGNLQSYDLLKYIFQINKITHVIHFAAQTHVQTSFTDSLQYTKDNILGTHTLLEIARLYSKDTLEKFIHVSTDEVYGESMLDINEKHKTESSILCPTNPYAATKAGAELIAQSYKHSFKMPIIITRGNNVYGPNQYIEKVIPCFINQLKNNQKITIQGDGSCIRAFLHSEDTANAFICILKKGKIGEIYNIGCDEGMEYSIIELAKLLIKKIKNTDNYDEWITFIEDRPFNDKRYYISNKKLKELGWKINIKFNDGIDDLI